MMERSYLSACPHVSSTKLTIRLRLNLAFWGLQLTVKSKYNCNSDRSNIYPSLHENFINRITDET
jgi:hypothetical protein